MATVNNEERKKLPRSVMAEEAYDQLLCYYDGVDEIVEEIAHLVAAKNNSYDTENSEILVITKDHVEEAGRLVFTALRDLISKSEFSSEISE